MTAVKLSAVEAVAAVMADLDAIGKGNKGHGYQYRGIDDVMNALAPLLPEHGVVIVPAGVDVVEIVNTPGRKDGWTSTRAVHLFEVWGPDGSSFTGGALGEGTSNQGTGPGIAASYAYKTFCLQLFCIPTQDLKDAEAIPPAEGVAAAAVPDARAVEIVALMQGASDDVKAAWKKANGANPHALVGEALSRALEHAKALTSGGEFVDGDVSDIHPNQGELIGDGA